jgi:2-alkyl-3-oxoalkanoate reductase
MTPQSYPKKILVTGGGGFLGSAIVRMLREKQYAVASFSRGEYTWMKPVGVEQVRGDIRDAEALEKACMGVDTVFHVAALPGVWGKYEDYFGINVEGTRNVISACRACGVKRLIYTSSPSVIFDGSDMEGVDESVPYPEEFHAHYPRTKAMAEREVRRAAQEGLHTISLRPHLIWGPGDNHLVPRILARAKRLRQVGDGQNLVDTIYIDNAAHAHVLAAERLAEKPELSGRVYFISQEGPVKLWDMVNAILAAGAKPPVSGTISANFARRIGAVCEMIYTVFRISAEPPMTRFVANELSTSHWFDIGAAKRDLEYVPLVSTGEGLQRLSAWLETQNRTKGHVL